MAKRIIVTGGSGQAGRNIITYLLDQGHDILNLDLMPLPEPLSQRTHSMKVDLTDAGQVFSALSSHFKLTQPFREPLMQPPDAVIHLGGYARNMLAPDSETFRVNVLSTHNILEAACKLGVKKIILASSVCVYGVTYAEGDVDFPSFPIDEELDTNPMDVYSITKVCGENICRGYARRYCIDVYVFRIGALVCPGDYATSFREYVNHPSDWKVHGWSYIDARDLGKMCHLGVMVDGLGFQVFNATNDHNTTTMGTMELLMRECPNTPFTREMSPQEAPMSNKKIKNLLCFRQQHDWKNYYAT